MELALLDCLKEREEKRKEDGRAPFFKEKAASPEPLKGLSRRFRRYGAKREEMEAELRAAKTPDLVLVTTIMTYWYPGAVEAVRLVRTVFPKAKIVVGGIYTSLCPSHAAEQMAASRPYRGKGRSLDVLRICGADLLMCSPLQAPGRRVQSLAVSCL